MGSDVSTVLDTIVVSLADFLRAQCRSAKSYKKVGHCLSIRSNLIDA